MGEGKASLVCWEPATVHWTVPFHFSSPPGHNKKAVALNGTTAFLVRRKGLVSIFSLWGEDRGVNPVEPGLRDSPLDCPI